MKKWLPLLILAAQAAAQTRTPTSSQTNDASKPLVVVMATGGTIAHVREGFTPDTRIQGQQLIKDIPQLAQYARFEVEEVAMVGSADLTPEIMLKIARRLNKLFSERPEVAGAVVTIGSNSMEEMAFFLNLTVHSDKPVTVTAAQRLHGSLGADGDINLLEAVRVAVSPQSRGMGVLVVVNDEIHSARDVRKTISHRLESWNDGDLGDLGFVDHDGVDFYRQSLRKHTTRSEFDVAKIAELPRVDIVYSYTGADGALIDAAIQAKAQGIVTAAFPTGAVTPPQVDALHRAVAAGIPVVYAHRGGRGRTGNRYPEFIEADTLPPPQARLLLMLALTRTHDQKEIRRFFREY